MASNLELLIYFWVIINYVPVTTKAFIQSTDVLLESSGIKYN